MKILSVCAVFALAAFAPATAWKITSSEIHFNTKSAKGSFKNLHGRISFDEKNPESGSFDVSLAVKDISTGIFLKNTHARSKKWLDADAYPEIRFVSHHIRKTGNGYTTSGTLTLHGISKEATIPFTFKPAGSGGEFNGSFSVRRSDYKVGEGEGTVGDQLDVTIHVTVARE